MPRATSQRAGRATPSKKQAATSGRYTAPIPRDKRHSPAWYPFVIIGLLVVGLVVIIANYAGALPGGTHDWYLIGGIAGIVAGLILATYYR
ncbi:MAG TPA: cell division protein CrgA [Acidimicrobiales bacterium]|nr:cell division protein CrgA [Acidimicrobiales bacterium]